MINKLKKQLEVEKKEREETQAYLLGLLEDVCEQLEKDKRNL